MKIKSKNPFMLGLITVACIALFTNFSWAGSTAVNHHKTSYNKDSRNIDLVINRIGGYYSYNHGRRYGNHGHNGHNRKHKYRGSRYSKKHSYNRQKYTHKRYKYRQRHGNRYYYGYKHGYPRHYRGYEYGYQRNHSRYKGDDEYYRKGYDSGYNKGYNDGYIGYDKDPEHAYKYSQKSHGNSTASVDNHKGFFKGYEDGFREGDKTR